MPQPAADSPRKFFLQANGLRWDRGRGGADRKRRFTFSTPWIILPKFKLLHRNPP
jgi:hypothetical protein